MRSALARAALALAFTLPALAAPASAFHGCDADYLGGLPRIAAGTLHWPGARHAYVVHLERGEVLTVLKQDYSYPTDMRLYRGFNCDSLVSTADSVLNYPAQRSDVYVLVVSPEFIPYAPFHPAIYSFESLVTGGGRLVAGEPVKIALN